MRRAAACAGAPRFLLEFLSFGVKNARACLFVGLFFGAVFLTPRAGLFGLPRYDVLLVAALAIQAGMVWSKLETWDELKAVCLFHVAGFALEVFKVSGAIAVAIYTNFFTPHYIGDYRWYLGPLRSACMRAPR